MVLTIRQMYRYGMHPVPVAALADNMAYNTTDLGIALPFQPLTSCDTKMAVTNALAFVYQL